MSKPQDMMASRRQFLTGAGVAAAASATTVGSAGAATALDTLAAAQSASVVLHDPRIPMSREGAARLTANGARIIALDGDAVRLWRTEVGTLLARPALARTPPDALPSRLTQTS